MLVKMAVFKLIKHIFPLYCLLFFLTNFLFVAVMFARLYSTPVRNPACKTTLPTLIRPISLVLLSLQYPASKVH